MIPPGSTIGVLGGGQLGRMFAMAARSMGYRVRALDPDAQAPARAVVDELIVGRLDDPRATAELAFGCDVVTLEIENIAPDALAAVGDRLAPRAEVPRIVRDRCIQREWLAANGFPQGAHVVCPDGIDASSLVDRVGADAIVKSAVGGYDGRGQSALADRPAGRFVVERRLALDREISVLVARTASGEVACYAPATNHHRDGVLEWSVLDGVRHPAAEALACRIATTLDVVGLLCVELFDVAGELLVNELAPRPHNSYHGSERACVTSQFEQHVRAVCDLPLGRTDVLVPTAIWNLLGDRWTDGPPDFRRALAMPGVRVHLYGKTSSRPGRKMGHLSAVGATAEQALARVRAAAG